MEDDNASGLPPEVKQRMQRILSFLQDMEREEELRHVQG